MTPLDFPLNLPQTKLKLIRKKGQIYVFCPIRKKNLVLTPEEWVRQHFVAYLVNEMKISVGKIISEYALSYNGMNRRADIVVLDNFGKPFIIVECKAPQISLTEKTFFQIAQYHYSIPAKILILTNGINHQWLNLASPNSKLNPDLTNLKEWI